MKKALVFLLTAIFSLSTLSFSQNFSASKADSNSNGEPVSDVVSSINGNPAFKADSGLNGNSASRNDSNSSDFSIDFSISEISLETMIRMKGKSLPESAFENPDFQLSDFRYLSVLHKNLQNETLKGELIVNKKIASIVLEIFKKLYEASYPIEKIKLIDDYNANDELSMTENNSSAFCYRTIARTNKLSNHAMGFAIDINPLYNPYIKIQKNGEAFIQPAAGEKFCNRENNFPYKIEKNDLCYRLFAENGFEWGGDWNSEKDYQHFEWQEKDRNTKLPETEIFETATQENASKENKADEPAILQNEIPQNELPISAGRNIVENALDFSLATEEEKIISLKKYDALETELSFLIKNSSGNENFLPEQILDLLYKDTLLNYEANSSEIQTALIKGIYNCVSSSILYYSLASTANLPVKEYTTQFHAFCTIELQDENNRKTEIIVETTNPYGYNPGVKKEIASEKMESSSRKYFVSVPKKNYVSKKEAGPAFTSTLCGHNILSSTLQKNNFEKAIPLAEKILVFINEFGENDYEKASAREDFDAVCSNYIMELLKQHKFTEATTFLSLQTQKFNSSAAFSKTTDTAISYICSTYLNENKIESAETVLNNWKSKISEKSYFSNFENIQLFKIQKTLNSIGSGNISDSHQQFEKTKTYLESIPQEYLQFPKIKNFVAKQKSNAEYNWGVKFHNEMVPVFNKKDFAAAKKILFQALEILPNNKMLLQDKKMLEQAEARQQR